MSSRSHFQIGFSREHVLTDIQVYESICYDFCHCVSVSLWLLLSVIGLCNNNRNSNNNHKLVHS